MLSGLNTLFTGQVLMRLDAVSSTNDFLKDLARDAGNAEGMVVTAQIQHAGRGQRGTIWSSEPGKNLIMSVLYRPAFLLADQQFYLSKAVALAVASVVRQQSGGNVQVKWPNDVLLNGKKVCGILIENLIAGNALQSVVGIGLNVNQDHFPEHLTNATSMSIEAGKPFVVDAVLKALCETLEANYLQLRSHVNVLDDRYEQSLFGMNQWLTFEADGREFSGCIKGVDAAGKLLVEQVSGKVKAFALKEIQLVA